MDKKVFRYKKNSTPGKNGARFKIALDTEELEIGWMITNDKFNGFSLYIDSTDGNIYTVRVVTNDMRIFMPPELLKCGTEYEVLPIPGLSSKQFNIGTIKIL